MKKTRFILALTMAFIFLYATVSQAWITRVKNWLIVDSEITGATLTTVDIDSGSIDGTTIGAISASTGAFTTLSVSGLTTLTSALTQTYTTTADSYTTPIAVTWTAGADMTAGGSNGIYIQSLVNEDVQNVYGHRSRIDLRSAAGTIATNQLHAFDGLINLDDGAMTVIDNISAVGVAIYSVGITAGDITVAGGGYGSFNGMRVLWHAEEDFTIETNGLLIETGASSHCDYGLNVYNDGTMTAGIWLHNNPAGGDTMACDIKLSSGATITTGSGAPSAVAPEGSVYIRTDVTGGSAGSAIYINTDGATNWQALT